MGDLKAETQVLRQLCVAAIFTLELDDVEHLISGTERESRVAMHPRLFEVDCCTC